MSTHEENARQYGDSRKLRARARLNRDYTIAETPWFSWVLRQLDLKSGDHVLDIGCGPGWLWSEAANDVPQGLELTLADLSPGMVDEAVQRCRPLPFKAVDGQVADVTSLPFEDGTFDTGLAAHMLYHVADPAAAIAEMFRVLKPGGTLAVTTNGVGNMRELYELATVFGSAPTDPSAAIFGFDTAERLMRSQFGNVSLSRYPAVLRITDPDDIFLALTSYPPGDRAGEIELNSFRQAIDRAFARGKGALETQKETGLFRSRKAA
ncbi:class I SAM-dependent methyltransferase [Kaistia granuli]|uniref:class I SAM-dependent methyltransferase n=1 Tax=Kaistia granuli TaxID=363259 RepID=UPI00035C19A1|nr:class I SAM-dependent methyltransferase [Kaistia granuli]